jgi:dihydroorotate dehydrogenase (NAD+) catalytic subunit|tara:strand:+ start:264 stop:1187 length:924 start_codon:yes stop_codon:yes gene_type:complete
LDDFSKLDLKIGSLALANPVLPASGCFGPELGQFTKVSSLGAIVPKTIFLHPRKGNPSPRTAEAPYGMLNSVGIPSKGLEDFLENKIQDYLSMGPPLIVSIGGINVSDYWDLAEQLNEISHVEAIEINVSCPNIEEGGLEIGSNPKNLATLVDGVVKRFSKPVITKLTPNVTSITDIAVAAESSGSTAVSLINTLAAIGINSNEKTLTTGIGKAGLSGPAIKPIALKMVWEVNNHIRIPIIGMGGISNTKDALEFILAGASAISIGTANFTRPNTMLEIIDGLESYAIENNLNNIQDIRGEIGQNVN